MTRSKASADPLDPPPGLALVRDFINTLHMDTDQNEDSIDQPEALERWLAEHKLLKERRRLSEADVAHAQSVREALRDLLDVNEGKKADKCAVETLSRAARSAQLLVTFEADGEARLRPAASGVDAALGEILGKTFQSMVDGSWQRLKACRADTCRWAFYDRSRNRSGAWCSMRVCGNRAKARTFRRQHA